MNSDNSDQMALSDLDVEIDRDNQVKSDFLDKLDKLRYRYNDEEVPLKIKKLVDEAYDLAFNSFVKKTKKQKNKVLYPNRKQSKHHKPQLRAGVNEIGFNPGNTKQVVRPIIKRKISRKRKTRETAFEVTKTRTKVNKRRTKCIISEKECKQKDFVSLANSSTVPKNVKSYSLSPEFWQSFISIEVCRDCIPALASSCKKQLKGFFVCLLFFLKVKRIS